MNAEEGIAIIGLSGRFPGAENVEAFWRNLVEGRESITNLSDELLAAAGFDPAVLRADASFVPARGLLSQPEYFDAGFFGFTPKEAEVMDPQQRIFLEEAWTALEDAGIDPERSREVIGVFAGMSNNTYFAQNVAGHPELIEAVGSLTAMMANEKDYLATRTAYKLNLRGPALNIYTACSTSLVAVCQACTALQNFQCDVALAGGISVTFPHERGYEFHKDGITSPDGHCRAFDVDSAGTVFSNGVGIVVLKRLGEALADGDQIYAVIKGSALNNDGGSKASFTAPSAEGHAECIALAHALAEFPPETVTYVEAHGTATPLGDPIEIAGLTKAFRAGTSAKGFCAIGSVKTNIGHLDAAAGIAGLIKTALALKHRTIPASLHFTAPNPKLELEDSPFFVNAKLRIWESGGTPRRAGVSSFGVGGTNAHVALEEAPEVAPSSASGPSQLLVFSAKSAAALDAATSRLREFLVSSDASIADVAFTLQTGRAAFRYRRAIVCASSPEAVESLSGGRSKGVFTGTADRGDAAVAFMFPGQGAQRAGMGSQLYRSEPVFRKAIDRCAEILQPELPRDLQSLLFDESSTADETLRQTRLAQPALFAVGYALAKWWMSRGVQPDVMVGHSVGEYVAACLAGVFSLEDALRLVVERARMVQAQPPGAMLAVRLSETELTPLLGDHLSIAAVNAPNLCIASGPAAEIEHLAGVIRARGSASIPLATSHAFHSAMMDPVVAPFAELVKGVTLHAPKIRFVSTLTGTWITDEQAVDPEYWAAHVRATVRFSDALHCISGSPHLLLECGPGQTLTQLARQHPSRSAAGSAIPSLADSTDENVSLHAAVGQLWVAGASIDWSAHHGGVRRQRISLPTYPFERQRFWAQPTSRFVEAQRTGSVIRIETDAPAAEAPPQPTTATSDDLLADLLAELQKLSGIDLRGIDPATSFLALGFDSLSLTQASLTLQKRFRVPISMRRLLEDLASPSELAAWLADNVPGKLASQTEGKPARSSQRHGDLQPAGAGAEKAHGPFKRVDISIAPEFTADQLFHLEKLVAHYTARTAESKRLTALNRPYLADPRAVSGFRRAWKEMIYPIVADRSEGSNLWDVDGNKYVDVTLGFGQTLLGHRPQFVVDAVEAQLHRGFEIGPTSPLAGQVAALMREFTDLDRVAFCNTGSEAITAAIRVARTVTGRSKIALFTGAYHGINDEVLVRPHTKDGRAMPIAPGIEQGAVEQVLILDYGSPEALELLRAHADELAAVLVEPVQSRRPELQPRDFLHELRRITADAAIALIFDEVVTGFRIHPGGAQAWFGVKADLATYGKIVGGGLPIGLVAGSARFMDALDGGAWSYGDASFPEAGVTFFAGTFVRHPLALASAKAVLEHLKSRGPALQEALNARTEDLVQQLNAHLELRGVPMRWTQFSSMYYLAVPPEMKDASLLWFHLRARGIYAWESRPSFLSTAHSDADVARIVAAFGESVDELIAAGFIKTTPALSERMENSSDGMQRMPITEAQAELFAADRLHPDASRALNESVTLRLRGPLDLDKLAHALNAVVKRHEALRTGFSRDGEFAEIHPAGEVPVPLEVLSNLPASARAAALAERIAEESSKRFEITSGGIFRARLFQLESDDYALVLSVHHIGCDGWSMGTVIADLASIYRGDELAPPTPFRAYAAWLRHQQNSPEFAHTEAFWRRQFSTLPPALELPVDHPRAQQRSFRGGRVEAAMPGELLRSIKMVGAAQQATLLATLLTAFHVLLHRLSGQTDVVVGIAAAGQAAMGRDDLVGHCLNFLPIRTPLDPAESFAALLRRMKTVVLDALEHQHLTFGTLLQKLSIPREANRMPLLGATFNIDRGVTDLDFGPVSAEFEINPKPYLGLELSFNLIETDRGSQLYCAFNRDLFEPPTIERWLRHFFTLLENIAAAPETPLAQLSMLTELERQSLLTLGKGLTSDYPSGHSIGELFDEIRQRQPSSIAVIEGDVQLTYAELGDRAGRVANGLRADGLRVGDLIGLSAERSARFVVAILGIVKAGGAYVPLDASEPAERLAAMHRECARVLDLEAISKLDGSSAKALIVSSESPAYVLYTSGSTGTPKGVLVPHRAIARLVINSDYVRFQADEVVAFASNVCFDAATFEIWGALLNGGALVITPRETLLSPPELTAHLARHAITTLFLTTSLFDQLAHVAPAMFGKLRNLVFGGEAANAESVARVLAAGRPQRLVNGYGPTEATTFAICHVIEKIGGLQVPIGRPIANTSVYLLDDFFEPAPIGVTAQLYLAGPGLALGYLNDPALTAERFLETKYGRLYRTGDLGRWLADGAIAFEGRVDQQIKLRGFRIEPAEIERALQQHPGVARSAVTVHTDAAGNRGLVAYFIPNGPHVPEAERLREFAAQHLPAQAVPAALVAVDSFPLTANGKLDWRAFPAPDSAPTGDRVITHPRNETERAMADLWTEVLGKNGASMDDDFFLIGGHSLLALRLLDRIREEFKIEIPVRDLFAAPTIAGLARRIAEAKTFSDRTCQFRHLISVQAGASARMPLFLIPGGWGGEEEFIVYRKLAHEIDPELPVFGLRARGSRDEALRHESVVEMAASYVTEICEAQPRGPYLLAGECVGAVVAYEMARMLEVRGEHVGLLALLDAERPAADTLERFERETQQKRWRNFWNGRIKGPAREHWQRMAPLHWPEKLEYIWVRLRRGPSQPLRGLSPEARHTLMEYPAKMMSHRIEGYAGKVTLILSEEVQREHGQLGWERNDLHPNLEVLVVPGDHDSYIRAHASSAAEVLRRLISEQGVAAR